MGVLQGRKERALYKESMHWGLSPSVTSLNV